MRAVPQTAARWLRDRASALPTLPDLHRLSARDWLGLGTFAAYKLLLVATVVYVWVRIWDVLVELHGELLLLVYCLLVFPTLVHYWRPLLAAWRKASLRVIPAHQRPRYHVIEVPPRLRTPDGRFARRPRSA